MAGDKIDRGQWLAARGLIQVTGARQPGREFGQRGVPAAPEISHPVPVLAVPFGPQRGEVPDLVAILAHVPRLGDQLDLRDDRVLLDQPEECRQRAHRALLASEHGREVEPEAVDPHLGDPVPQRVHDQRPDLRMPGIEAVPAAAEVHVASRVVLFQPVVRGIVDSPEADGRPLLRALAGVVVDHIDEDLDPDRVQCFHHALEFAYLPIPLSGSGITVVRGEVADGVIAPVVGQPHADQPGLGHELVDWHELDRADAEALQVADHGRMGQPSIGAPQLRRYLRMSQRQAANMDLIDDRVGVRDSRVPIVPPVEGLIYDDRTDRVWRAVRCAGPQRGNTALVSEQGVVVADRAADRLRVGVQE